MECAETQGVQLELAALRRSWVEEVAPLLTLLLPQLGEFTTDELHGFLRPPQHDNWWGVLMAKLKNEGRVERVNARPSKRPEANGRLVSVWRWKAGAGERVEDRG